MCDKKLRVHVQCCSNILRLSQTIYSVVSEFSDPPAAAEGSVVPRERVFLFDVRLRGAASLVEGVFVGEGFQNPMREM